MVTFENYCEGIKRFGGKVTYTKEEYELKYGVPKEFEPMIITPRNQKRPMKATFENSKKAAVRNCRTTEKSDHIVRKHEKVARPKKPKAANPPKTNRIMSPKTSLKGMTDEQIKEHRRSQNRIWKAKQKLKNPPKERKPALSHEERKARARARYHERKPTITRIFYKDLTPEELAAHLKEQRRLHTIKTKEQRKAYREANKEKYKEYGKEWARKNADKRRESNRKYIEANKEKVAAQRAQWNKNNREKRREINNRADAKRRGKKENICTLQEAS